MIRLPKSHSVRPREPKHRAEPACVGSVRSAKRFEAQLPSADPSDPAAGGSRRWAAKRAWNVSARFSHQQNPRRFVVTHGHLTLEHWLDNQIQFDSSWEDKVVARILSNLGMLLEQKLATVQELNRYRKQMAAAVTPTLPPAPDQSDA